MKRLILSEKEFNAHIPESEWLPRLNIPKKDVQSHIYDNILAEDEDIFRYLIDNRVITTIASNADLRNNPYYELEDKLITLSYEDGTRRTYSVPYPGTGRFGSGNIYTSTITIFDDGSVAFGDKVIQDIFKLKPSTLKSHYVKNK